jgi:hypothetical protein
MQLIDLVRALLSYDALAARQWVADATREGLEWHVMGKPAGLDATGLAVAAGVVEMLAARSGQRAPEWTAAVPAAPAPLYLVRAASSMPRLRRSCEEEGPEPLRRRLVFAPPEFLTAA